MNTAQRPLPRSSSPAFQLKSLFAACCAVLTGVVLTTPLQSQVVAPQYAGAYTLVELGQASNVPFNYGGLTFKAGDPNTLLIGGRANGSEAAIFEVTVQRGGDGHITGFSGLATQVSTAAGSSGGIDGGLTYGPEGTLFYTVFPGNEIGQILPGSSTPDYLFSLQGLTASSVGSIVFVPPGFSGAGQTKILSYSASRWYTLDRVPHAEIPGTFEFTNPTNSVDISAANGPEGAVFISAANPLFNTPSVLIAGYAANKIVAFDLDANSDPIPGTARDFVTGLGGAEGAAIDPVTGDFLFSTFGGVNKVIAIRGFVPPPAPTDPIFTELHTKGGAVPGAGSDLRIQTGAIWNGFGTPAVSDEAHVAFLGKWKAPAIKQPVAIPAQSGTGIFVNNTLLVKVGDPVPGLSNAVFKSFKDPVIASNGRVAFIAAIKGSTSATVIPSSEDTVVVTNGRNGSLEVLAREGAVAPDCNNATFKAFSSVSIQAGPSAVASLVEVPGSHSGIVFTGSLNLGTGAPATTVSSDTGAWWLPAERSILKKAIREGDSGVFSSGNVKSFVLLKALGGSPGFGRGNVNGDTLLTLATSTAKVQGLIRSRQDSNEVVVLSGDSLGSVDIPEAAWAKLGMPSVDQSGTSFAMLGQLKTGPTGVPTANAKGVFSSTTSGEFWEPIVRSGEGAPGFPSGAVFTAFKDPLNSPTGAGIAFLGTVKPAPAAKALAGIWFKPEFGNLVPIATQGAQPPGAPSLAQWKSFASVALPGGQTGPIFTAFLLKGAGAAPGPGGITSVDDFGLYFANYHGTVRELIRENQPLLGKTVKSFNVLKAVSGSAGSSRAFNHEREIVVQVTFTDKSVSIVHILLPQAPTLPLL